MNSTSIQEIGLIIVANIVNNIIIYFFKIPNYLYLIFFTFLRQNVNLKLFYVLSYPNSTLLEDLKPTQLGMSMKLLPGEILGSSTHTSQSTDPSGSPDTYIPYRKSFYNSGAKVKGIPD